MCRMMDIAVMENGKMDDYISRQAALDALNEQAKAMEAWSSRYDEQRRGILSSKNIINDLPSADVQLVRHGHWIINTYNIQCSECGRIEEIYPSEYCMHCGARMDEREE